MNLYIDSKDRVSGTSSEFTLDLAPGIIDTKGYSVGDVAIQRSYYNINEFNNSITFTDSTATDYTITTTPGNYTLAQYIALLAPQMTAISADTITITFDSITGAVTFSSTGNLSLQFQDSKLALLLGFEPILYTGTTTYTGNVVQFGGTKKIYICSKQIKTYNYHRNNPEYNILTSVTVNADFGELITKRQDNNIIYRLENTVKTLDLYLLDDNADLIELNGTDWNT